MQNAINNGSFFFQTFRSLVNKKVLSANKERFLVFEGPAPPIQTLLKTWVAIKIPVEQVFRKAACLLTSVTFWLKYFAWYSSC